jgi:hypothetical protein
MHVALQAPKQTKHRSYLCVCMDRRPDRHSDMGRPRSMYMCLHTMCATGGNYDQSSIMWLQTTLHVIITNMKYHDTTAQHLTGPIPCSSHALALEMMLPSAITCLISCINCITQIQLQFQSVCKKDLHSLHCSSRTLRTDASIATDKSCQCLLVTMATH